MRQIGLFTKICASNWFIYKDYTRMQGQQSIKAYKIEVSTRKNLCIISHCQTHFPSLHHTSTWWDIPHEPTNAVRSNTEHCFEKKRKLAALQALATGSLTLHKLDAERSSLHPFNNDTFTFVKSETAIPSAVVRLIIFPHSSYCPWLSLPATLYRAFHNVLRDYKNVLQDNRRTRIYETCTDRRNSSKIFSQ